MQILAANFDPQLPNCPACRHGLHRHGHYVRRREGSHRIIPRWFCRACHRTFSILPADLLPYRNLSCAELQDQFDRWAFEGKPPISRPAVAALRSFLAPALQLHLRHACGQLLDVPMAAGQVLWRGLRRLCSSVDTLLPWLAEHYGISLLGCYLCQRENGWSVRTPRGISSAAFQGSIPHTFSAPDGCIAPVHYPEFRGVATS